MSDELHYEEFCGSIYLYNGGSKDILRMVDGTDEIALAFERTGSPSSVKDLPRPCRTT